MFKLLWCLVAFLIFKKNEAYTYRTGSCPKIQPLPGFNMEKFLGLWYVIQKTSSVSQCTTYNIITNNDEEPGQYLLGQDSQRFIPLRHNSYKSNKLSVPDRSVPGRMKLQFKPTGSASFVIFSTDYKTYAGIFSCQKLGLAHRQSATILSRKPTLDLTYINEIRSKLSTANIDPFQLTIINQNDCPHRGASNIDHSTSLAHTEFIPAPKNIYLNATNTDDF